MFSHLTQKKCPLCSRLSSRLKKLFRQFYYIGIDCQGIHLSSYDSKQRVAKINTIAPSCTCEEFRMSKYSSKPVGGSEILARFIFSPMHIKKGRLLPSVFSHVHSIGCSVQRESIATTDELVGFAHKFLSAKNDRVWKGVLLAKCDDLRNIKTEDTSNRLICIYDTAERDNPAHGEMGQTQYIIEEADQNELRSKLFTAFDEGKIIDPNAYRDGAIWCKLQPDLKTRI